MQARDLMARTSRRPPDPSNLERVRERRTAEPTQAGWRAGRDRARRSRLDRHHRSRSNINTIPGRGVREALRAATGTSGPDLTWRPLWTAWLQPYEGSTAESRSSIMAAPAAGGLGGSKIAAHSECQGGSASPRISETFPQLLPPDGLGDASTTPWNALRQITRHYGRGLGPDDQDQAEPGGARWPASGPPAPSREISSWT